MNYSSSLCITLGVSSPGATTVMVSHYVRGEPSRLLSMH
jgi:hypothetical protein